LLEHKHPKIVSWKGQSYTHDIGQAPIDSLEDGSTTLMAVENDSEVHSKDKYSTESEDFNEITNIKKLFHFYFYY